MAGTWGRGRPALLEQGPVLGGHPLRLPDLSGLHADDLHAGDLAARVHAGLAGEVEERFPCRRSGAEHEPGVSSRVGLAGAVDTVEEPDEGQFG